jgi:hypothetical protein
MLATKQIILLLREKNTFIIAYEKTKQILHLQRKPKEFLGIVSRTTQPLESIFSLKI